MNKFMYIFSKILNRLSYGNKRQEYKHVWNKLAIFPDQAVLNVIGNASQKDIQKSAEETRKDLENTVGINQNDTILEIGCGIGRVGLELAPRCAKWIGCDVSGKMLNHAKRNLQHLKNVQLLEISGYDLKKIKDCSVDMVYCTVVFMHLDEWDRYNYICEAHRILRPGGRIFVDNFNLCSDEGWKVFEYHRKIPHNERSPFISKSSTPQEIEAYLVKAGFNSIKQKYTGLWVQGYAVK